MTTSTVWVQAQAAIFERQPMEVFEVENTPTVQAHIDSGYLVRITKTQATRILHEQAERGLTTPGASPTEGEQAANDAAGG